MADYPLLSPTTAPEPSLPSHVATMNYVDGARSSVGFRAADHGFLAWAYDPLVAGTSTALSAAGVMHLIEVKLAAAATVSSIMVEQTAAASGLTNCYAALYNGSGTRVGLTANQATAWQTSGFKDMALATAYSAGAGTYYIGLLVGAQSTAPTFRRASASTTVNANLTAAGGYRFCTSGSGLTTPPTSVTLSSTIGDTSAAATGYWAALK